MTARSTIRSESFRGRGEGPTLAQDSGIPVGTVRLTVGRHGSMKAGGRADTTGRLHVPDSPGVSPAVAR